MDPIVHQLAEGSVYLPLSFDAVQSGKQGTFNAQREMTFTARIVASMADMLVALILEAQAGRRKRCGQPLDHFAGDGSGGGIDHRSYIGRFVERGSNANPGDQG
jgi:hypothetical protein